MSLIGIILVLLMMLTLTGCSQETILGELSNITGDSPEEIVGHGKNIINAIKDTIVSLLSYDKLRYLLFAAAAICIVIGLFKKVFWLCVVAAILFVTMAIIKSGILGNTIVMVIDALERFIAPFIKDPEADNIVTTAIGSARYCMMLW